MQTQWGAAEGGASVFFVSAHLSFYIMNMHGYSLYGGVRFRPRRGVKGGKKILKHVLGPNLKFCGLEGKIHAKIHVTWDLV